MNREQLSDEFRSRIDVLNNTREMAGEALSDAKGGERSIAVAILYLAEVNSLIALELAAQRVRAEGGDQ